MFFGEYPINSPYIFSRGSPIFPDKNFTGSYCYDKSNSSVMSLIYSNNQGGSEIKACQNYIKKWKKENPNKKVLRIAYKNSIGGQILIKTYLDLLIIAKDDSNLYYYVFEYAGKIIFFYNFINIVFHFFFTNHQHFYC
jgi:hypothetical protein